MNNNTTRVLAPVCLALTLIGSTVSAFAGQQEPESQIEAHPDDLAGYLKVGFGYKNEVSPYFDEVDKASVFVNGRYQWQGFFVEAFYGANERNEGLSIGYNFFNTERWSFDVSTIQAHGNVEIGIYDTDKILVKDLDSTQMLALRATGTFGQTSLQFLAAPYSFNDENDEAFYAAAWLGHTWYLKNWEFQGSLGLKYSSEELLSYYFDILPQEATAHFGAYDAGSGVDVTAKLIASYPISQHWTFESYVNFTDFSSSIMNNPAMKLASKESDRDKNGTEVGLLVSYIF